MVDLACGMAILRGADIFIQGIMAAPPSMCDTYKMMMMIIIIIIIIIISFQRVCKLN